MTNSNSSTPDTPDTPEARAVERRVTTLLTRYAEDMPSTTNTESRLRQRLAAPEGAQPAPTARARWLPSRPDAPHGVGGWARAAVSVALVAALIVGFFAVVRLRNSATGVTTGGCTEIQKNGTLSNICPPPNPVKVSIQVTQSYADALRTVVQLRIATPGALIPHDRPIIYSRPNSLMLGIIGTALYDAQGRSYGVSGLSQGAFQYPDGQDVVTDYRDFDPLPQSALSSPQTLTLRISELVLFYDLTYQVTLKGPWSIPFQVTPQPGRSINLHVAPQTHNGITIQPLRLDIAPSASVFDRYDGGARMILRVSGLDPKTSLLSPRNFDTVGQLPDGSGWSSTGGPQLLFEGRHPATIAGIGVITSMEPDPSAVVGPTGTVDLEIIFVAPPLASLTGTQTLTIDKIDVTVNPMANPSKTVKGPWVFQIPLG